MLYLEWNLYLILSYNIKLYSYGRISDKSFVSIWQLLFWTFKIGDVHVYWNCNCCYGKKSILKHSPHKRGYITRIRVDILWQNINVFWYVCCVTGDWIYNKTIWVSWFMNFASEAKAQCSQILHFESVCNFIRAQFLIF